MALIDSYRMRHLRLADLAVTGAMLLCLVGGGGWLAQAAFGRMAAKPAVAAVAFRPESATPEPRYETAAIESVRLGRRLVAGNPLVGETAPAADIDPATWRAVRLSMLQGEVEYDLAFLRPLDWLGGRAAGDELPLSLPELGLDGIARIVAVESCPEIEPDDGEGRAVVTGTMRHPSGRRDRRSVPSPMPNRTQQRLSYTFSRFRRSWPAVAFGNRSSF